MARQESTLVENIKTLVYAGLIAIGIRTIAFEPFNIPSGSMVPTLLVGDYLFVSKYSYGYSRHSLPLSLNLFQGRIFARLPDRGDVAVFKLPKDNTTDYIKRIVGLPGDKIQMKGGQLFVNGTQVPRADNGVYIDDSDYPLSRPRKRYQETLPASPGSQPRAHDILKLSDREPLDNTDEFEVPAGHVFAMGDNRDNSQDSRVMSAVGYIPIENLVGRAEIIFFSIGPGNRWWEFWTWPFDIRWSRLLRPIR